MSSLLVFLTLSRFERSNLRQTKELVEKLGGKTMSGKEKEGDNGWYMYFLDVEGNRFGVYELQKK